MQNKMKKWIAYGLALALVLTTLLPIQSVQAASKPKLNATKKTMVAGERTGLKVSNKVKNAKYTWSTSNKNVARVSSKGSVKAVKKGSAVISCKVKVKNKTKYTLKCKVTVTNEITVKSQKELNAALKNSKATAVILKTDTNSSFSITKGDYTNKEIIVDAPNAHVENSGQFKSIVIKNIKPNTWVEKASNNTIEVTAKTGRVVVDKNASVKNITFAKTDAKVSLEVEGNVKEVKVSKMSEVSVKVNGTVGEVSVDAASASIDMNVEANGVVTSVEMNASAAMNIKAEGKVEGVAINSFANVTIEGNAEKIPVKVSEAGEGATLKSSVPVEVTASSDVSVTLEKGAEGSQVKVTTEKVEVVVKNESQSQVAVTTPSGTTNVDSGKDVTTNKPENNETSDNNSGNNNSGNGNNEPIETPTKKVTSVTLDKNTLSLYLGLEDKLTATVKGEGNIATTVTWTSSDDTIASVKDGVITANKKGEVTITATSTEDKTKTATCTVTVHEPTIALDKEVLNLQAGTVSEALVVTVNPQAYGANVVWSSDETTVATVDNGVVTAVAAGEATITATITVAGQTFTAKCQVTVTSTPQPEKNYSQIKIEQMEQSVYDVIVASGSGITVSGSAINITKVASFGAITVTPNENAVTESNVITITGSLENVGGQYYLPIQIEIPEALKDTCSIKETTNKGTEKGVVEVNGKYYYTIIIPVASTSDTITFVVDLDEAGTDYLATTYTLNLADCTLK